MDMFFPAKWDIYDWALIGTHVIKLVGYTTLHGFFTYIVYFFRGQNRGSYIRNAVYEPTAFFPGRNLGEQLAPELYEDHYRDEINSLQIQLSRIRAEPGRAVKEQQEQNSPNHVQRINLISVDLK